MNRLLLSVFWMLLTAVSIPSLLAQENDWPKTVPLEKGMVTIYALQVDEMHEDSIQFRAALAYRESADAEPVFGAGWFESPVQIDSSNRVVHPTGLTLTQTRFPANSADIQPELSVVLARQSRDWNLDIPLNELETALQTAEAETKAAQNLNTAPPRIIYRDHPALLVSMDGEPLLREIENSPYQAVINTPYPLITDNRYYYLNAAKNVWYRAKKAIGPYQFESNPPADIAAMVAAQETVAADEQATEIVTAANAPEIVVSTEPAELIVTEGPAAFVPLVDDLLVLQNSDSDVFMHVGSQNFYIVLAGRWYRAGSLNGPWTYEMADQLPTAFANIPQDSNQADSRVYVAGTEEARDAILDAEVPQTAAVERGVVDIEVKYDGQPIYQAVDGTDLVYIQNTGSTVLQADGLYYLVEDGVWYVAPSPGGPWQVSDHRPAQVDTILPTSPVYNVKYVHVYESTPDLVYVGYTPGYTGSYVYRNTIFYGTGWYYRPWVSPYYYYPRFSTWGYNVSYNPWGGWNFGLSWGWGPFNVAYYSGGYWHQSHYWHHRHYGHWGPRGYRSRPKHHGHRSNRYAYNDHNRNGGGRGDNNHRRGDNDRYERGDRHAGNNQRNDNLYRDRSQRARVADTRDNQPRLTERRNNSIRQANRSAANNTRQKNYNGVKKGERNKATPISSSDLRVKANLRNANSAARQGRLLVDNSGDVYRKAGKPSNRSDNRDRENRMPKSAQNRRTAQPRDGQPNRSQNSSRTSHQANAKSVERLTTQPVRGGSNRQTQTRSEIKLPRRQPSKVANTTDRNAPPKNRHENRTQPSSRATTSSVRVARAPTQNQAVARAQPKQQSSRNISRANSQPGQSSQKSRSGNQAPAQSSRGNSRSKPATANSAPKRNAQKSSGQKNVAKSRSGKRSDDKKSRD